MTDHATIRERYRRFAEVECRGYSNLYDRLAVGAAADNSIVRFIADRSIIQPNLLFAAVQFVCGTAEMPVDPAELAAVLATRGSEIAAVMETRRTQTNEVGRCAVLLPALPPGPLALLEVGASAGLCLLADRFFYDYVGFQVGDLGSSVRLACRAEQLPPERVARPEIVWRRGLDIAPVDVHDDDAVRWLLACVWADHPDRRARLAAAIQAARSSPPAVVEGDLVDDLAAVASEAPTDATLVVFHSAVLPYIDQAKRLAFAKVLRGLARERPLVWISNEAPGVVPSVIPPSVPDVRTQFVVGRSTFSAGHSIDEVLAVAHPHGASLTWLAG